MAAPAWRRARAPWTYIDISLDYGLTLLAALLIGTGFVLQQYAAQREPDSRFLSAGGCSPTCSASPAGSPGSAA